MAVQARTKDCVFGKPGFSAARRSTWLTLTPGVVRSRIQSGTGFNDFGKQRLPGQTKGFRVCCRSSGWIAIWWAYRANRMGPARAVIPIGQCVESKISLAALSTISPHLRDPIECLLSRFPACPPPPCLVLRDQLSPRRRWITPGIRVPVYLSAIHISDLSYPDRSTHFSFDVHAAIERSLRISCNPTGTSRTFVIVPEMLPMLFTKY